MTDRKSWEEQYLPKLQWSEERVNTEYMKTLMDDTDREIPIGLHCGSLIGYMRNLLGVEQLSYLYADDEELICRNCGHIGRTVLSLHKICFRNRSKI